MGQYEDKVPKTFRLYPHHMHLLKNVNENLSESIRLVLDEYIEMKKYQDKKAILKENLIIVSFGILFILLSFNMINFLITIFATAIGLFLISYGVSGGIINAIRRTR